MKWSSSRIVVVKLRKAVLELIFVVSAEVGYNVLK